MLWILACARKDVPANVEEPSKKPDSHEDWESNLAHLFLSCGHEEERPVIIYGAHLSARWIWHVRTRSDKMIRVDVGRCGTGERHNGESYNNRFSKPDHPKHSVNIRTARTGQDGILRRAGRR